MSAYQKPILRPVPTAARFVSFALTESADAKAVLRALGESKVDPHVVIGIGMPLLARVSKHVEGLRPFPTDLAVFPATQAALWGFWSHPDPSEGFDACHAFLRRFSGALTVADETATFLYRKGRDLSGFEDGTENPKGKAAEAAAIIQGAGRGLDGGSFVAVQRWVHDLDALATMSDAAQAHAIGRSRRTNKELADAPPSAHVKRAAQEQFDPPAFIVRKSMPYGALSAHGLYFVAFGASLDRFERILRRMAGRDDGIVDGLFSYSHAVSGAYYFCPPVANGKLDLRAVR
jgi:putative iron-dependent peroxidase